MHCVIADYALPKISIFVNSIIDQASSFANILPTQLFQVSLFTNIFPLQNFPTCSITTNCHFKLVETLHALNKHRVNTTITVST